MLRYKIWSFILWIITKRGNHKRSRVNKQKKTDLVNLFEAQITHIVFNEKLSSNVLLFLRINYKIHFIFVIVCSL